MFSVQRVLDALKIPMIAVYFALAVIVAIAFFPFHMLGAASSYLREL